MSNALSIAAVTATLRNLIDLELNADVAGTQVTTRPPGHARDGINGNQVNLFLYHVAINPAWRNTDLPWRVRPGEVAPGPLPLNLYYLLTAYSGENDDDIDANTDPNRLLGSHRLMGQAMRTLHDHPVIQAEEIQRSKHAINEILAAHTCQPLERIQRDSDRDFFMDAPTAKEYGLVDQVVQAVYQKPADDKKKK